MMDEVTLTIDGVEITTDKTASVLEAALQNGIHIPHLCYHPDLKPVGSCRLCVVEIEGTRGFPTTCTTPVATGMVVRTQTPEVVELRRNVLRLLLSGHTSPCLACPHRELCEKYCPDATKAGKTTRCGTCSNRDVCELRELFEECGIDDLGLPIVYRNLPLERTDPFMDRDYNLCVLCGRCVRVCEELHDKPAIDLLRRGKEVRIGTAFIRDHTESGCLFCGACIDVCPTGALSDRFSKWHGAPDRTVESTCTLCALGCAVRLKAKDDEVVGSGALALTKEARICGVGRFVLPQIAASAARRVAHSIRTPDGLRETPYEMAVAEAAARLADYSGPRFALIAHPSATREDLYVLEKFTREVMKSADFIVAGRNEEKVRVPDSVQAVFATGDYLLDDTAARLSVRIIVDAFPSSSAEAAGVVFAPTTPTEVSGTYLTASGAIRSVAAAAKPPEGVQPDWRIVCDIASRMGARGFDFTDEDDILEELTVKGWGGGPPPVPDPSPLDDLQGLPRLYRGHKLADISRGLRPLLPACEQTADVPSAEGPDGESEGRRAFEIVEKQETVPNMHMITVSAPEIAATCEPGQFVIAMANEQSERIPYTVADFDRQAGTVTVNVLEMGRSSREMVLLKKGDRLAHVVGPLGRPIEVRNYGTVVCGGGCYGVSAMLPIARALKKAGNRVICIEEAASAYMLYWHDELAENCDELIIATKDGSAGVKGGVQEVISMLVERGEKIDQAFIIGCTFMMMLVSEATQKHGIPTMTAMNPIMMDGTGMCGACRVTVGGETKFACIDGPFLDGHQIDWTELMQRRAAFMGEEIEALPQ